MASYPASPNAYPVIPKAYPASPKVYPGSGINVYPGSGSGAPQDPDARNAIPSEILAYYDVRPTVSGAAASMTFSSTLQQVGGTSPAVTIQSAFAAPRQCTVFIKTAGALGTMAYSIWLGDGTQPLTGVSPVGGVVSIGGGDTITFGAGPYSTADFYDSEVTTLAELTGLANASLTSTLAGRGAGYRANGLNGTRPALHLNTSALTNENGIPALATGTDAAIEVTVLVEEIQHIGSTGAGVIWGFCNQTDTAKSFLDFISCGHTIGSGLNSAYAVQRRDSQGSGTLVRLIMDRIQTDLDPHVISAALGASGQVYFNNMPGVATPATTNRGVGTTLNRFSIGGIKLGTSPFSSANWWRGYFTALVIHRPLSAAQRLSLTRALAA